MTLGDIKLSQTLEGRLPSHPDLPKLGSGFTPCPSHVPAVLGAGNKKDLQLQVRQDRPLQVRSPDLRAGDQLEAAGGQHREPRSRGPVPALPGQAG